MRKRYSLAGLVLVLLIMRGFTPARALDRVLKLDGIVEVKGNSLVGTRMVVLSQEGKVDVRSTGLEHFTMELDLHTSYLFSFERKGCVTKQLYFDTRVPSAFAQGDPFEFPFKVTLESPPKGQSFEYAHPVGTIHFQEKAGDFIYDKDYSKVADPALAERMQKVIADLDAPKPVTAEPMVSAAPAIVTTSVSSGPEHSEPVDHYNIEVPTIRTAAPLVHNTGETKIEAAPPVPASAPPPPPPAPSIVAAPRVVHIPAPPPVESEPSPVVRTISASQNSERTEELIVARRTVTTIVRITKDDQMTEYRRVAHAYGPIFFFKNGESCSELIYQQGIEP